MIGYYINSKIRRRILKVDLWCAWVILICHEFLWIGRLKKNDVYFQFDHMWYVFRDDFGELQLRYLHWHNMTHLIIIYLDSFC